LHLYEEVQFYILDNYNLSHIFTRLNVKNYFNPISYKKQTAILEHLRFSSVQFEVLI